MKVVSVRGIPGTGAGEHDEGYLTPADLVVEPGLTQAELQLARRWFQLLEPIPSPPSKDRGNLVMLEGGRAGVSAVIDTFRAAIGEELEWDTLRGWAIVLVLPDGSGQVAYDAPMEQIALLGLIESLRNRVVRDLNG